MNSKTLILLLLSLTTAHAGDPGYIWQVFSTQDARIWVPNENGDIPDAQHADRAIEVNARLLGDVGKGTMGYAPEVGAHMRFLVVKDNALTRIDLAAAGSFNDFKGSDNKMAAFRAYAEGETARVFCEDAESCKLLGVAYGADVNLAQLEGQDTPYMKVTPFEGYGNAGLLFTKNNRTWIVKGSAGGHLAFHPSYFPGNSKEMFASVGASGEMHLGNRIMMLAALIQHFGLNDEANKLTEGKLKLNVRLWHQPIDRDAPELIKDVSLQAEVRVFAGELRGAGAYRYNQIVPVNTVTGNGGLIVGF